MNHEWDRKRLCGDDVSAQEKELLVRLMEEAGELIQACSKTLRWGWERVNPTLPIVEQISNRELVQRELADVDQIARRLQL